MRPDPRDRGREPQLRINHRIRVPEVRVIDGNGDMLGVLPTHEAMKRAQAAGLDLVEVNPKAVPPVCKILDFGKFKYEEKKKTRDAKRKQTVIDLKEIKLRPKTDDHDLEVKLRAAQRFIENGNKVKFTVRFRGREIAHPQKAQEQLDWLLKNLEELCTIELRPAMEGKTMSLVVGPKPVVMQRLAQRKAEAERIRQERLKAGLEPEPEEIEEDEDLDDDDDEDDDDDDAED